MLEGLHRRVQPFFCAQRNGPGDLGARQSRRAVSVARRQALAASAWRVVEEFRGISPNRSMQNVIAKEPYVDPMTSSRMVDAAARAEQTR